MQGLASRHKNALRVEGGGEGGGQGHEGVIGDCRKLSDTFMSVQIWIWLINQFKYNYVKRTSLNSQRSIFVLFITLDGGF